MIETALLTKQINFKLQTKISLVSSVSSGVIGIVLAFFGFGYWSLAVRTITQSFIRVVLLRSCSSWRPKLMYSIDSFKDLFGFGAKLLADSLLNTIYRNIYKIVIGKYFSATELGFYTRADNFKRLPTQSLEQVTLRVTYPVLASLSGDLTLLKRGYKKMIKLTFFISSFMLFLLLLNAREIVLITVGEQWAPTIPYLQILCFAGIVHPLNSLNVNAFKAVNRADVLLKLAIVKKISLVPILVLGVHFGMKYMLWGMAFHSYLTFWLNSTFSARLINYSTIEQLKDIAPTFVHTLIMAGIAFTVGTIAPSHLFLSLFMKTGVALLYMIGAGYLFKIPEFIEIKAILSNQVMHHYDLVMNRKRNILNQG